MDFYSMIEQLKGVDVVKVALIVIAFILILDIIMRHNTMQKLRNSVKRSRSGVDVYLNQRFDLIPNLVNCVKAYCEHEKELLEKLVTMRTEYNNGKKEIKKAEKLSNDINKVLGLAENYPDLKVSEQFLNLQNSLRKMENQLQAARRVYNMDVEEYNNYIQSIPNNMIAPLFGFEEEEFFSMEENKNERD